MGQLSSGGRPKLLHACIIALLKVPIRTHQPNGTPPGQSTLHPPEASR